MSNRKDHEYMEKLDSCYKLVEQSSAKGGIRAVEIAEKLGVNKTTVYDRLNSLQFAGKVYSDQGRWKAKTEEQTIMPLEKEIVITFPIPEKKYPAVAQLAVLTEYIKGSELTKVERMLETLMEKFDETRTIKIKGKNVDDLDLEKVANMILQTNEKSSKFNLKRKLKNLKL